MILRTLLMKDSDASSIVRRMNELLKTRTDPDPAMHHVRQSILRKLRRQFRLENRRSSTSFRGHYNR